MEELNQTKNERPDLANAFGEPNEAFIEIDGEINTRQSFNATSTEANDVINSYDFVKTDEKDEVLERLPFGKERQSENKDIIRIVQDEKEDEQLFSQLRNKAEIFGVSPRQLETEFIEFKITKLMKKIDLLVDGNDDDCEIKGKINDARRLGLGSVTVAPTKIEFAKSLCENSQITINSSVFMNDVQQLFPVKVYAVKKLKNTIIKDIVYPIEIGALKIETLKLTEKQLKKIKRSCKEKKLKVAVDVEKLTQSELISLVKLCIETNVDTIVAKVSESGMSKIKSLFALSGGKITIEARGNFALMFAVSLLAFGIAKLSIENATIIAEEIRVRLTSENY